MRVNVLICPAIECFAPLELMCMHSYTHAEAGRQRRGAQGVLHAGSVTRAGCTVGADDARTSVVGARSEVLSQNASAHARESGGVSCNPFQVVEHSVSQKVNTFRVVTTPTEFIGVITSYGTTGTITISYKLPEGGLLHATSVMHSDLAVEFHSNSADMLRLPLREASDAVDALGGSPAMRRTCRSKNTAIELSRIGPSKAPCIALSNALMPPKTPSAVSVGKRCDPGTCIHMLPMGTWTMST
jgi:hypothetical protein